MLEVMARINENAKGIALVVDPEGRFLDTVTDGDLRRAVLAGLDLKQPVSVLRGRRKNPPLTAPEHTPPAAAVELMRQHGLRHLPLLDAQGRVASLAAWSDFLEEKAPDLALSALVMAGGKGLRLRPLTEEVPKPLLPLGDRPLLERTIGRLRDAGVRRVFMATHYKPEAFTSHFGAGDDFGVDIDYIEEDQPLGTAGALALLSPQEPLLVINGDIVTDLNYRALLAFHEESRADLTVGVREYEFKVPYGVVDTDGVVIRAVKEKPVQRFFVNAGVYLLQPQVCDLVPKGQRFDMTDLIATLLERGRCVVAFPISEYWIDIGQMADYEKAQAEANGAVKGAGV